MLTGKDHRLLEQNERARDLLLQYAETVRTVSTLSRRLSRLQKEQQQSTTLYTRQERTRRELAAAEIVEEEQHARVSELLELAVFLPDSREVLRMRYCFLMEWDEIVRVMYCHEPDFNEAPRKYFNKATKAHKRGLVDVEQFLITGERSYSEARKRPTRICF